MTFTGAFIIPKATYNNEQYLYFGVERGSGEVSAFGGKRDTHENIQKCARRELKEESHGVFARDKSIKKRLANQKKYHVHKIDKSNTCVTYIVPVKPKGNPMQRFAKENSKPGLSKYQKEMTQVIAVKASEIISLVKKSPHGTVTALQGHKVRPLLQHVLREAVQKNYI